MFYYQLKEVPCLSRGSNAAGASLAYAASHLWLKTRSNR